jgi:hypothetical protein
MRVARHRAPAWTGPRTAIALVQVLGLAVWFSASAVVPRLRAEWGIGEATAVWLTVAVQLGFVAGAVTSAVLTLPDRVRPHRLLAWSALGAAACTLVMAAAVDTPGPALALRGLTGVFLAGVYPVGMKLTTSWSGPGSRVSRPRPPRRRPDAGLGAPASARRPRGPRPALARCPDRSRGRRPAGGAARRHARPARARSRPRVAARPALRPADAP